MKKVKQTRKDKPSAQSEKILNEWGTMLYVHNHRDHYVQY